MNNPLKYIDPSGHVNVCGVNGDDCENDRDAMIEIYYESEPEAPLILPIERCGKIVGREYYMPQGSQQSSRDEDSLLYRGGRVLAGAGVVIDGVEAISSAAMPGGGVVQGFVDAGVTYVAGVGTGDNYFPLLGISDAPPGLPENVYSVNQDLLVNLAEASVPFVVAPPLGIGGIIILGATPVPGDELALLAYSLVDVTTSLVSAAYDGKRFEGDLKNHLTIGISGHEIVIVHWP